MYLWTGFYLGLVCKHYRSVRSYANLAPETGKYMYSVC